MAKVKKEMRSMAGVTKSMRLKPTIGSKGDFSESSERESCEKQEARSSE